MNEDGQLLQGHTGQVVSAVSPSALVQGLSNVQVDGNLTLVGRDLIHFHEHHHYHGTAETQVEIPPFLQRVPNFRDIQIATLGKATSGTGDWIYVWEEFCVWLAPDGYLRILWGSGIPGAGKTILASIAINAVEAYARASTTPISVGFLYIRYSDNARCTVRNLLEVLVRQTVERHPTSLSFCNQVYSRHIRENTEPSMEELFGLLKRFTSELTTRTFYFLDALDEAPSDVQLELLETLTSLNVKLFITSRPLKPLEARFPEACHFPIVAHESDLDVHIGKEMSRSMELQAIIADASPGLEGRITLAVKKKCSGMFLHASLQMQALRQCTNRHELNETLEDFPEKIADVYIRTWERITNQAAGNSMVSLATKALAWVLYATRSLTVDELRHAIATSPDTHKLELSRVVPTETLLGACCGLLVREQETGLVRLVHYTAKPILRKLVLQSIPEPHTLLSAICMARLRDCGFQRSALASTEELDAALNSTTLLLYAYRAWSFHGRESMHDDVAKSRLLDFVQGCHAFPILPRERGTFDRFGPLHVIAAFDLPLSLAGSDQLRNPNQPSQEQGLTPLHLACMRNSRLTVKDLLAVSRILVNAPDKEGSTPLIWASRASNHGNEATVALLLSHPKVKVNQANNAGFTALHAASAPGRTGALQILLAHSTIKINQGDNRGIAPFMIACRSGDMDTLNLFLRQRKLNVNAVDKAGTTALMWMMLTVAAVVDIEMVKAVLAHPKIDPNLRDKAGKPASYWAYSSRRQDILDLFLNHPKAQRR
ncbi:hypothetical protein BKA70DRAFT_55901 [Coprinopsis sp. MPI-PUGE-AT-0042]|nr:hypothetical protein BKA70DRAFT_55901 [Coprinopsis sp. MPI-PUGE-AT-0042]